jgi:probable addiction module antidote protein
MALKLTRFDAADFLETDEDIDYYLRAIAEDNDPVLMASALGDVARARGMSQLSRETGISRMGLTKALSAEGNPSFATITKVLDALGYRIDIVPKTQQRAAE